MQRKKPAPDWNCIWKEILRVKQLVVKQFQAVAPYPDSFMPKIRSVAESINLFLGLCTRLVELVETAESTERTHKLTLMPTKGHCLS